MNFVKKGKSILIILNNWGKINLPEVATKNKIVYPSQDPAIFEIKYPALDIRGRVVTY